MLLLWELRELEYTPHKWEDQQASARVCYSRLI